MIDLTIDVLRMSKSSLLTSTDVSNKKPILFEDVVMYSLFWTHMNSREVCRQLKIFVYFYALFFALFLSIKVLDAITGIL